MTSRSPRGQTHKGHALTCGGVCDQHAAVWCKYWPHIHVWTTCTGTHWSHAQSHLIGSPTDLLIRDWPLRPPPLKATTHFNTHPYNYVLRRKTQHFHELNDNKLAMKDNFDDRENIRNCVSIVLGIMQFISSFTYLFNLPFHCQKLATEIVWPLFQSVSCLASRPHCALPSNPHDTV